MIFWMVSYSYSYKISIYHRLNEMATSEMESEDHEDHLVNGYQQCFSLHSVFRGTSELFLEAVSSGNVMMILAVQIIKTLPRCNSKTIFTEQMCMILSIALGYIFSKHGFPVF